MLIEYIIALVLFYVVNGKFKIHILYLLRSN